MTTESHDDDPIRPPLGLGSSERVGLVERLRHSGDFLHRVGATAFDDPSKSGSLYREAADEIERLRAAVADMLCGWRYIRQTHGELYGVGWDRAQEKAEKALGIASGELVPDE